MKKPNLQAVMLMFGALFLASAESRAGYEHSHEKDLVAAAFGFERAARNIHRVVAKSIGRSHLTASARELARAARHYRRQVKNRRGYRNRRWQFDELAARFHHLRHHYRHAYLPDTRQQRRAWRRLVQSFRQLRHESYLAQDAWRDHRARGRRGVDHRRWRPRGDHQRRWFVEDLAAHHHGG